MIQTQKESLKVIQTENEIWFEYLISAPPVSRKTVTTEKAVVPPQGTSAKKATNTNAEKAADTNDDNAAGTHAKKTPDNAAENAHGTIPEKSPVTAVENAPGTIQEKSPDTAAVDTPGTNPEKSPDTAVEKAPGKVAEELAPTLHESLVEIAPTSSSALLASRLSSLPPGPSSQSSILSVGLSSQAGSSSQGGLLGFLSCMPLSGLSHTVADEVFDPEQFGKDSDESDESDEGDAFRKKAFSAGKSPARMVRTRSQTSQSNSVDMIGKIIFAHKGKSIPCWFPGKVLKKTSKGLEIEFFAQLGVQICTEKNTMLYDDFFLKRGDSSSTLFKVPLNLKDKFEEGLKLASSK